MTPCIRSLLPAILLGAVLFAPTAPANAGGGNATNDSFSASKKTLLRQVYSGAGVTFYCGAFFNGNSVSQRNGYVPVRDNARANRIEWEHIVPAHAFGQSFPSWRNGHPSCESKGKPFAGRNCSRKVDRKFRLMEADMHNLVPAIGEINGLRSNYSFAMISGEPRRFGSCDMEIEGRKAEPRPAVRGDIARIYFYMEWVYPGHGILSRKNRKLFAAWDAKDPVDAWECARERKIAKIQGNRNPFVEERCR